MTNRNFTFYFSARSEVGLVRTNNEDNLYCNGVSMSVQERDKKFSLNGVAKIPCVFAVCDGMGGEACGELASLTTVNILDEYTAKIKSSQNTDEAVQSFIADTNKKLCEIMRENFFRMGTTLALAVISDNFVRAYNIGDSRIYKIQNGIFSRISQDHTIAAQKIKMGLLTEEQARYSRDKHILTRCLGVFDDEITLTPDIIRPFKTDEKFRLLLCSDGLTDMLTDEHIKNILFAYKNTSSAADALVENALKNGGRDNITCIIIDFQPE